jgi:predicted regulator of Ras-like GTPase activity (Roadblock/LC7/MglB family)
LGKKVATGMADEDPGQRGFSKPAISKLLKSLLKNAKARCALWVDKNGFLIAGEGKSALDDGETISALVAGSFAATKQMARLVGEKEFSILFHQGTTQSIQLSAVGDRTILAVLFDKKTTLGKVRLYASQVSLKLLDLLSDRDSGRRRGPGPWGSSGPPVAIP